MSTTTRMGSGLAVDPDKDLAMFADMARRGKHLNGIAKLGHGWRFSDGDPEDAVFDLTYERDPSPDYLDIFRTAGWTPVLSLGDAHIFKAAPGTAPVHTMGESKRDELSVNRNRYLRHSAIAVAVFALVALGLSAVSWPGWIVAILLVVAAVPVCYTVVPLIGYGRLLRKLDARRSTGF